MAKIKLKKEWEIKNLDEFFRKNNIDRGKRINVLNKNIINCDMCINAKIHTKSYGNPNSKIMFILLNAQPKHPKKHPYVCTFDIKQQKTNRTGGVIEYAFKKLGKNIGDYYFTNIVKCSHNSEFYPDDEMKKNCKKFFKDELEIIKPKYIIIFGNRTMNIFNKIKSELKICSKIIKMTHPAYYLRRGSLEDFVIDIEKMFSNIGV